MHLTFVLQVSRLVHCREEPTTPLTRASIPRFSIQLTRDADSESKGVYNALSGALSGSLCRHSHICKMQSVIWPTPLDKPFKATPSRTTLWAVADRFCNNAGQDDC